jgi:hypothetical protein
MGELERMLEKTAVTLMRHEVGISVKGLKETTKKPVRILGIKVEIRTIHLPNIRLTSHRLT